jgi:hypothetical protein
MSIGEGNGLMTPGVAGNAGVWLGMNGYTIIRKD